MKKRLNNIWMGFAFGLVGLLIGMFITMAIGTGVGSHAFAAFTQQFVESPEFRQNVLFMSIVPNPILFFIFNKLDMENCANGVVGISLILTIYVIAIAIL